MRDCLFTVVQDTELEFSSVVKCLSSKPKALGSVLSFKKRKKKEKDKIQEDSDLVYILPRSQYIYHLFYFALIVE